MATATGDRSVRVLVVEDAPEFRRQLVVPLVDEGFQVETAEDGERGVELARSFQPDVIVLDLLLPKVDGVEVCRRVRTFSDAYIVMLTAKDEEIDRLVGLSVGADDYLTKPVSSRELVARIRAMLRRPRSGSGALPQRQIGALLIDPVAREVRVDGSVVELTRLEFDLLDILSSEPRVAFSRERLLERLWGPNWHGDPHVVDVHISKLRRKLGDEPAKPRYIRTVRGVGFRIADES